MKMGRFLASIRYHATDLSVSVGGLRALLGVDAGPEEGGLPRVDLVLRLAGELEGLEVLVDVAVLGVVDGEHVPAGHEPGLDVAELQLVEREHELLVLLLEFVYNILIKINIKSFGK